MAYALNMAVGHKMFLNPPPFANISYLGDLEIYIVDVDSSGESSRGRDHQVIDLEAPPVAKVMEVMTKT